jgi:tRNA(fMet)-specific endonuclease VapC
VPGRALLDTSAADAFLRGDQLLIDLVTRRDEVYLSVVAVGELLYGARHSSNRATNLERVASFVVAIVVLPCDDATAEVYARVKQDLRVKGRPIPDNDLWIAATTIQHGLVLVNGTLTSSEQIEGLERESW